MSRDEARAAVLAFLDQFIARGAGDNLRELRRHVAATGEIQRHLDQHLADHMTEREAFDAMRRFLADMSAATRTRPEETERGVDVFDLLSWTEWEADGQTSDPAQWDDWTAAVAAVTAP